MTRINLAGAAALVCAPVVAAVAALVTATESDAAATRVAAWSDHHGAMIAGSVLEVASIVLFAAGLVWLAVALAPRSRNLAVAGGIFGLAGSFVILFEDGLTAAQSSVVSALGQAQATSVVDAIHSSGAATVDPLATLQTVGVLMLAVAAGKVGAPRWAAAAFALGGVVDTVGFGSGTKGLIVGGFAILLAGAVPIVRTIAGREPLGTALPQTAS